MPTSNKSVTAAPPAAPPKPRGGSSFPAVLVLIAGGAAAFAFRQDGATSAAPQPQPADALVRRAQPPIETWRRSTTQLLGYVEAAPQTAQPQQRTAGAVDQAAAWSDVGGRSTSAVAAAGETWHAPPPMTDFAAARTAAFGPAPLATMRPYEAVEAATAPGALSSVPANSPRSHVVRNGDTLGTLAERYYGDARRYREIYDSNRATLSDPDLLPIGAKLVIPAYDPRFVPPAEEPPAARLVPQVMIRQP
jgi:nucleoid-associated protein YgaU